MHNVAKAVQDKVSQGSSYNSFGSHMQCQVDGPLNAISTSANGGLVAVAGRNVFKVYGIEEDKFVEKHNLRVGRHLNLNYSILDVAWNPVEDNLLATCATNGAVVTWNLGKSSRSKQDQVFTEHKRTVNRICFHSAEAHYLLSGSSDGAMKLFDLRKKEAASTFFSKSQNVRDVHFNPHHYFSFASAYESGFVQFWDLRKPSAYEREFTAHGDHVFTFDWHPEEKHWIATAGRDKLIKIWDIQPYRPSCTHTIQTIASVAKVKWRPQRKYHIASCALLVDFNINVWDIRRPYIPFAAFAEHKDVVTGIEWKLDPHMFLSGSKDSFLRQHVFRDAMRPADHANPVGVDVNIHGDVTYAMSDKLAGSHLSSSSSVSRITHIFRPKSQPGKTEQFTTVSSLVFVFENTEEEYFVQSAQRYLLTGKSVEDLCEHNASVADDLKRPQVAQTWRMLKQLYCSNTSCTPAAPRTTSILNAPQDSGHKTNTEHESVKGKVSLDSSHLLLHIETSKTVEPDHKDKNLGDITSGHSDSDSDVDGSEQEPSLSALSNMMTNHQGDLLFDDGEIEPPGDDYEVMNEDWFDLPNEAFQPRHEISDRTDHLETMKNSPDSPPLNEPDIKSNIQHTDKDIKKYQEPIIIAPATLELPQWEFRGLVIDMMDFYANQGDIQMSASVLIVLGDKIKPYIDINTQEHWLMAYIDLLGRFQLWSVATEVINLSVHPVVSLLNHQSTTVHTNCNHCNKHLTKTGWLCDRCKNMTNMCSVCHLPVKGLYAWCQGCSHGGHIQHIQDWLTKNSKCPAGCGHLCQYS